MIKIIVYLVLVLRFSPDTNHQNVHKIDININKIALLIKYYNFI